MPNGNGAVPGRNAPVWGGTVGFSGSTISNITGASQQSVGLPTTNIASPPSTAQPQNLNGGTTPPPSFMGEPAAVWIGLIGFLLLLKVLAELPEGPRILGENVNPAFMRIGAYNIAAVGVIASVWIVLMKVLFNRFTAVPALTAFANAV